MITDLDAYLRRIGFEGMPAADLPTLQQLALRHPLAIAFENLDPFTGRAVSLDPAAVEEKLVRRGRGGWCFEQNLLLGNALRALGFDVQDLAARVLWGRSETERTPRTHRLLSVGCVGRRWLVDVGFGALTPTAALDLGSRDAQATPHEPFRLRAIDDDLLLEADIGDQDWRPLYRFDLRPQWPMDFEAANFQLAHDPASPFVTRIVAARPVLEGRWTLRNRELTFRDRRGRSELRVLADAGELREALRSAFGLEVPDLPELESRFRALSC